MQAIVIIVIVVIIISVNTDNLPTNAKYFTLSKTLKKRIGIHKSRRTSKQFIRLLVVFIF